MKHKQIYLCVEHMQVINTTTKCTWHFIFHRFFSDDICFQKFFLLDCFDSFTLVAKQKFPFIVDKFWIEKALLAELHNIKAPKIRQIRAHMMGWDSTWDTFLFSVKTRQMCWRLGRDICFVLTLKKNCLLLSLEKICSLLALGLI